MENRRSRKIVIVLAVILIGCVITAGAGYAVFGHRLIRAMYEGKIAEYPGTIITGQSVHSLEFYYVIADAEFSALASKFFITGLCFVVVALIVLSKGTFVIISLILSLILFECVIAVILAFPPLARFGCYSFVKELYKTEIRNIIQLDPRWARYDPALTYTLKPGTFTFSNPEFRNEVRVNSLGLRDDEKSLRAPEVVVAGDSLAMGWGVDQDEAFAQIIEQRSGRPVLNAAVSSYGTVREMYMLNRVDAANLKYLIIYYVDNDYDENRNFYVHNNTLPITSEEDFRETSEEYIKRKRYYPGKYIKAAFDSIGENIGEAIFGLKKVETRNTYLEAKFFLNAIAKACKVNLDEVRIIVLGDSEFIHPLDTMIASGDHPRFIKNTVAIDVSKILTSDCFYIVDDHINAKGHRLIAEKLIEKLRDVP